MREVVLDTETTGISPAAGHRIVEIGCVELVNQIPSGATFHTYLNPERDMPADAYAVHGLSAEFLKDKPAFGDVGEAFLEFLGDAPLIAHNAGFDAGFINSELALYGQDALPPERFVDTIKLARSRVALGAYSLDSLCRHFGIDSSRRTKHGALLDAELLAEVYLALCGGRQSSLVLEQIAAVAVALPAKRRPTPLPPRLTEEDKRAHAAFVATIGDGTLVNTYSYDA